MSFKGKKNLYLCERCGRGFVSIDIDEGVTPFLTGCLTPDCKGLAQSCFYRVPDALIAHVRPAREWYRPAEAEAMTMPAAVQEHVRNGGLISRRTGSKPS